jgi:hypothetical protein
MKLRRWYRGNRYVLWPIHFRWAKTSSPFFSWHGWQIGFEDCETYGEGCVWGKRRVMGQVLHFGRFKIVFGELRR